MSLKTSALVSFDSFIGCSTVGKAETEMCLLFCCCVAIKESKHISECWCFYGHVCSFRLSYCHVLLFHVIDSCLFELTALIWSKQLFGFNMKTFRNLEQMVPVITVYGSGLNACDMYMTFSYVCVAYCACMHVCLCMCERVLFNNLHVWWTRSATGNVVYGNIHFPSMTQL